MLITFPFLCNAGKERSRILAASLESVLSKNGWKGEVLARGTYGLGNDEKGIATKYGWVPPEGFVNLLRQKGINLPSYPSQMVTEQEAEEAEYLIAVDTIIAKRARQAFPRHSSKVLVALNAIDPSDNPFHKYLGYNIPDAWGGHLSGKAREVLHEETSHEIKLKNLADLIGHEPDEEVVAFVKNYNPDSTSPTDIKLIPPQLRDYMGRKLDSDEAYLHEVDNLKQISEAMHKRGYFK